jgi:hypothetical protein
VLPKNIRHISESIKLIRVISLFFYKFLTGLILPKSAELWHTNINGIDKLEEVDLDFLSDKIGLFTTSLIIIVNATKNRTKFRLHKLDV